MKRPAPAAKPAKSVDTFRNLHDRSVIIPRKVKAALAKLAAGNPEHWEYETDFVKLAGVGTQDLPKFREDFRDHIRMASQEIGSKRRPKVVWFATAKAAKASGAPELPAMDEEV